MNGARLGAALCAILTQPVAADGMDRMADKLVAKAQAIIAARPGPDEDQPVITLRHALARNIEVSEQHYQIEVEVTFVSPPTENGPERAWLNRVGVIATGKPVAVIDRLVRHCLRNGRSRWSETYEFSIDAPSFHCQPMLEASHNLIPTFLFWKYEPPRP